VVAERLERMSGVIVAEGEEDVWVAPGAKPAVAESRVALEVDEPEVVLVRLRKGKKRRLKVGGGAEDNEEETDVMTVIPVEEEREVIVARVAPQSDLVRDNTVVPLGPRLRDGPRVVFVTGRGGGGFH